MVDDLKIIRKKYGEKMYHFCRESFPILLEEPRKLSKLLMDNFHESHSLYDDLKEDDKLGDFKNYLYSFVDVENSNILVGIKSPEELMAEAGYDLYECYTEDDIQSYRKYYASGEELCTFGGGRLDYCRVFFAVKKNVDDIKRENFKNPMRQDEYGTSVISIQFEKDGTNTLSIKNRYNHTVNNPDATFSNNLDNITPGLMYSFEKYKGIIQRYKNNSFEISNYVRANDGKFYKYNYEINNVYYCPDNIIIDNFEVKNYDKSRYLIIDYFIIDMAKGNKSIKMYDNGVKIERRILNLLRRTKHDCFCDTIKEISKIDIENTVNGKKIKILGTKDEYLEIIVDNDSKIISLRMDNIYDIRDNFLYNNNSLLELYANNVERIGNNFLLKNMPLQKIKLLKLSEVGNCFLGSNTSLNEIILPNLIKVKDRFLENNLLLKELYSPKLTLVGDGFLRNNLYLSEISFLNLKILGEDFLSCNRSLLRLNFPSLLEIGDNFMFCNKSLQEVYAPNLTTVGDCFLYNNVSLHKLYVPKLITAGNWFLYNNISLLKLSLPSLKMVFNKFLYCNESLQELYVPELQDVGDYFLYNNDSLKDLYLPKIEMVGNHFLYCNMKLRNEILFEIRMRNNNNGNRGRI